jgi:hypothetical protein
MEEEIEGERGMQRLRIQLVNEYAGCPERGLGGSVLRAGADMERWCSG